MGQKKHIEIDGDIHAGQSVEFPSISPRFFRDVADSRDGNKAVTVKGQLFMPDAVTDPVPAVIVVHGLGGQSHKRELSYCVKLARAGFAALAIDSFAARGCAKLPELIRAIVVPTWGLMADVFAALEFLAASPGINGERIGIVGFSWGGMISTVSAFEQIRSAFLGNSQRRFAAHAAYYGCSILRLEDFTATGAPVLVMVGKKDKNISVQRTQTICSELQDGGSAVQLQVFDAYHQWDGNDEEIRHFPISLRKLRFLLTEDGILLDEQSGKKLERLLPLFIACSKQADWGGYDMLRSPDTHRESDALLLSFFSKHLFGAESVDTADVPLGAVGVPPSSKLAS